MNINKIVIVTQDYFPEIGGITSWCYQLAKSFIKKDFEVLVVAKNTYEKDDFVGKTILQHGINVYRLNSDRWKNKRNIRISKFIRQINTPETLFICANWKVAVPLMFESFFAKINYIVAFHGLDAFEDRKLNKILLKRTIKKSVLAIAVSRFTKEILIAHNVQLNKLKVITNGVDTETCYYQKPSQEFLDKFNISSGFKLLSVGRLIKRKGFDYLIQALAKLNISNIHYYIAGEGKYLNRLKELISENNLSEQVHLLGYVDDNEMNMLYSAADLFVMPARNLEKDVEGFGIVYLDAAACKTPSIASFGNGSEDAVEHMETGVLVNPDSIDDIAAAIKMIYDDKNLRDKLSENAYQRAISEFAWDKKIEEYLSIIRDI